jgi:UDP-2,4-diacetamido-2,4,6-trideoxy-beta-L-altropyranose hydrolase
VTEAARWAIFRADASVSIGTGHVVRCRTLAEALVARGWRATLVAADLPEGLATGWPGGETAVVRLLGVGSSDAEPAEIAARAGHGAALVVGDHYGHGTAWFEGMRREQPGAVLVAIDDLADRALPVDIVLNQNLGATEAGYSGLVPRGARALTGPRFALLRPEFAALRDRQGGRDGRIERILVFMSGADPSDVTARATAALATLDRPVDVVVGPAYTRVEGLRTIATGIPRATVHVNTPEMASLMERADLAIGAPSSASWERCALGLPTVLITLADNQLLVGQHLADAGAAISLGWQDAVTTADIEDAVRALLDDPARVARMAEVAAEISDGRGTARVVEIIEAMTSGRMHRP